MSHSNRICSKSAWILACALILLFAFCASGTQTHQPLKQSPSSDVTKTTEPASDDERSDMPAIDYPVTIMKQLGLTPSDIINHQHRFKSSPVHTEWMQHIRTAVPEISPQKEAALISIHTALLFLKDTLDKAYYSGAISKPEFSNRLAVVMKWFQKANQDVLSSPQYRNVFSIPDEGTGPTRNGINPGKVDFPVKNPDITVQTIQNSFDDATINNLSRFYRNQSQELRDIRALYDSGDFNGADAQQVNRDIRRIKAELEAAFEKYCRRTLTAEEFTLLFGDQSSE